MTRVERAWAAFVARGIVGLMFVFAGVNKVLTIGPDRYATRVSDLSHLTQYFPASLIYPVAYATGFAELILGAMLILGIRPRIAARLLGAMVVLTTAGYGLAGLVDPVGGVTAMDVRAINTYILPRAALLILVLMLPVEDDVFTVEQLAAGKATKIA